MNKLKWFLVVVVVVVLAIFAFGSFGADKAEAKMRSDFSSCVEVSHADYPSGLYCPNEQAKARYIDLLIAKIEALKVQLKALQAASL